MKLHIVTITGADDGADIQQMVDLSREFPFVEWGILVSKSQEGGPRFPSRQWIERFAAAVEQHRFRVAMHLCGRWMRELLTGDLHWDDLPSVASFAGRFQFNTHGTTSTPSPHAFLTLLGQRNAPRTFIFQWNPFAAPLARLAHSNGFIVAGLFDGSGGAGKLHDRWPSPHEIPFPMGFAGGLGPDNVIEQLDKINAACGANSVATWIDMESRVRTDDGAQLDMGRVRRVLEQVADTPFVAKF